MVLPGWSKGLLNAGEDAGVLDIAVVGHSALDRHDIGGNCDSRRRLLFLNSPDSLSTATMSDVSSSVRLLEVLPLKSSDLPIQPRSSP
jgi:hypothetical protein